MLLTPHRNIKPNVTVGKNKAIHSVKVMLCIIYETQLACISTLSRCIRLNISRHIARSKSLAVQLPVWNICNGARWVTAPHRLRAAITTTSYGSPWSSVTAVWYCRVQVGWYYQLWIMTGQHTATAKQAQGKCTVAAKYESTQKKCKNMFTGYQKQYT